MHGHAIYIIKTCLTDILILEHYIHFNIHWFFFSKSLSVRCGWLYYCFFFLFFRDFIVLTARLSTRIYSRSTDSALFVFYYNFVACYCCSCVLPFFVCVIHKGQRFLVRYMLLIFFSLRY